MAARDDFFIRFGSNAPQFSNDLTRDLAPAKAEIKALEGLIDGLVTKSADAGAKIRQNLAIDAGRGRGGQPPQPPTTRPAPGQPPADRRQPPPPPPQSERRPAAMALDTSAFQDALAAAGDDLKRVTTQLSAIVQTLGVVLPGTKAFVKEQGLAPRQTGQRNRIAEGRGNFIVPGQPGYVKEGTPGAVRQGSADAIAARFGGQLAAAIAAQGKPIAPTVNSGGGIAALTKVQLDEAGFDRVVKAVQAVETAVKELNRGGGEGGQKNDSPPPSTTPPSGSAAKATPPAKSSAEPPKTSGTPKVEAAAPSKAPAASSANAEQAELEARYNSLKSGVAETKAMVKALAQVFELAGDAVPSDMLAKMQTLRDKLGKQTSELASMEREITGETRGQRKARNKAEAAEARAAIIDLPDYEWDRRERQQERIGLAGTFRGVNVDDQEFGGKFGRGKGKVGKAELVNIADALTEAGFLTPYSGVGAKKTSMQELVKRIQSSHEAYSSQFAEGEYPENLATRGSARRKKTDKIAESTKELLGDLEEVTEEYVEKIAAAREIVRLFNLAGGEDLTSAVPGEERGARSLRVSPSGEGSRGFGPTSPVNLPPALQGKGYVDTSDTGLLNEQLAQAQELLRQDRENPKGLGRARAMELLERKPSFDPYNEELGRGIEGNGELAKAGRQRLSAIRSAVEDIDEVGQKYLAILDAMRANKDWLREAQARVNAGEALSSDKRNIVAAIANREKLRQEQKDVFGGDAQLEALITAPGYREGLAERQKSRVNWDVYKEELGAASEARYNDRLWMQQGLIGALGGSRLAVGTKDTYIRRIPGLGTTAATDSRHGQQGGLKFAFTDRNRDQAEIDDLNQYAESLLSAQQRERRYQSLQAVPAVEEVRDKEGNVIVPGRAAIPAATNPDGTPARGASPEELEKAVHRTETRAIRFLNELETLFGIAPSFEELTGRAPSEAFAEDERARRERVQTRQEAGKRTGVTPKLEERIVAQAAHMEETRKELEAAEKALADFDKARGDQPLTAEQSAERRRLQRAIEGTPSTDPDRPDEVGLREKFELQRQGIVATEVRRRELEVAKARRAHEEASFAVQNEGAREPGRAVVGEPKDVRAKRLGELREIQARIQAAEAELDALRAASDRGPNTVSLGRGVPPLYHASDRELGPDELKKFTGQVYDDYEAARAAAGPEGRVYRAARFNPQLQGIDEGTIRKPKMVDLSQKVDTVQLAALREEFKGVRGAGAVREALNQKVPPAWSDLFERAGDKFADRVRSVLGDRPDIVGQEGKYQIRRPVALEEATPDDIMRPSQEQSAELSAARSRLEDLRKRETFLRDSNLPTANQKVEIDETWVRLNEAQRVLDEGLGDLDSLVERVVQNATQKVEESKGKADPKRSQLERDAERSRAIDERNALRAQGAPTRGEYSELKERRKQEADALAAAKRRESAARGQLTKAQKADEGVASARGTLGQRAKERQAAERKLVATEAELEAATKLYDRVQELDSIIRPSQSEEPTLRGKRVTGDEKAEADSDYGHLATPAEEKAAKAALEAAKKKAKAADDLAAAEAQLEEVTQQLVKARVREAALAVDREHGPFVGTQAVHAREEQLKYIDSRDLPFPLDAYDNNVAFARQQGRPGLEQLKKQDLSEILSAFTAMESAPVQTSGLSKSGMIDAIMARAAQVPPWMQKALGPDPAREAKKLYHGTADELPDEFLPRAQVPAKLGQLYGPGFYTTSSRNIAGEYAGVGGKGPGHVYEFDAPDPSKVFDLDSNMGEDDVRALVGIFKRLAEEARQVGPAGEEQANFYDASANTLAKRGLKSQERLDWEAAGSVLKEDPFTGMQELPPAAPEALSWSSLLSNYIQDETGALGNVVGSYLEQSKGADVLKHRGGQVLGGDEEHDVYIWLKPEHLKKRAAALLEAAESDEALAKTGDELAEEQKKLIAKIKRLKKKIDDLGGEEEEAKKAAAPRTYTTDEVEKARQERAELDASGVPTRKHLRDELVPARRAAAEAERLAQQDLETAQKGGDAERIQAAQAALAARTTAREQAQKAENDARALRNRRRELTGIINNGGAGGSGGSGGGGGNGSSAGRGGPGGPGSYGGILGKILAAINQVNATLKGGLKVNGTVKTSGTTTTKAAAASGASSAGAKGAQVPASAKPTTTPQGRKDFLDEVGKSIPAIADFVQAQDHVATAVELVTNKVLTQAQALKLFRDELQQNADEAETFEADVRQGVGDRKTQDAASEAAEKAKRDAEAAKRKAAADEDIQRRADTKVFKMQTEARELMDKDFTERGERFMAVDPKEAAQNRAAALEAQALANIKGKLNPQTKQEIAELERLVKAKADDVAISKQLVKMYTQLYGDMGGQGASARQVKDATKALAGGAGLQITGGEVEGVARTARTGDAFKTIDRSMAEGTIPGGLFGEQSAFTQALFGNHGFWSRIMNSTGTFIVRNFTAGFVFGMTAALQQVVAQAIETEATFIRVSAALEATGKSVGGLRTELQAISTDYGTALNDVYEVAAGLSGLFDNTQDLASATRIVSELEAISMGALNAKEAMGALASIMGAYTTDLGTGVGAAQKVADVLTSVQNNLGVNVEVSAEGVGRLAGLAEELKISFEETAVFTGQIAKLTNQTGAAAGEQFSRILGAMQTGRGRASLIEELGATTDIESQLGAGEYGAVLRTLVENWDSLSDAQKRNISTSVAGLRQAASFSAMVGDSTRTLNALTAAQNSQGDAADRMAAITNTLQVQLKKLSSNFQNLASNLVRSGILDFVGVILKGFNYALGGVNEFLSEVNTLAEENKIAAFFRDATFAAVGFAVALQLIKRSIAGFRATMAQMPAMRAGLNAAQMPTSTQADRDRRAANRVPFSAFGRSDGRQGVGAPAMRAAGFAVDRTFGAPLQATGRALDKLGGSLSTATRKIGDETVARSRLTRALGVRVAQTGGMLGALGSGVRGFAQGPSGMSALSERLAGQAAYLRAQAERRVPTTGPAPTASQAASMQRLARVNDVAARMTNKVASGMDRLGRAGIGADAAMMGLLAGFSLFIAGLRENAEYFKEARAYFEQSYQARLPGEGVELTTQYGAMSKLYEEGVRAPLDSKTGSNWDRTIRAMSGWLNGRDLDASFGTDTRADGGKEQYGLSEAQAIFDKYQKRLKDFGESEGAIDVILAEFSGEMTEFAHELANDERISGAQLIAGLAMIEQAKGKFGEITDDAQALARGLTDSIVLAADQISGIQDYISTAASLSGKGTVAGANVGLLLQGMIDELNLPDRPDGTPGDYQLRLEQIGLTNLNKVDALVETREVLADAYDSAIVEWRRLVATDPSGEQAAEYRRTTVAPIVQALVSTSSDITSAIMQEATEIADAAESRGNIGQSINALTKAAQQMLRKQKRSEGDYGRDYQADYEAAKAQYEQDLATYKVANEHFQEQMRLHNEFADWKADLLRQYAEVNGTSAGFDSYFQEQVRTNLPSQFAPLMGEDNTITEPVAPVKPQLIAPKVVLTKEEESAMVDAARANRAAMRPVFQRMAELALKKMQREILMQMSREANPAIRAALQAQLDAMEANFYGELADGVVPEGSGLSPRLVGRYGKDFSPRDRRDESRRRANESAEAEWQAHYAERQAARETAAARVPPGDALAVANMQYQNALANQADALHFGKTSAEYQSATQAVIQAQWAISAAMADVAQANHELTAAYANARGDAVAAAQAQAAAASAAVQAAYERSGGVRSAEVIRAEAGLVAANAAVTQSVVDLLASRTQIAIAIADAAGFTVRAASLQLKAAQDALKAALQKSGGEATAEVNQAKAAVITAERAQKDAVLQDNLDTIDFQLQMGRITEAAAISALKEILRTADLTKAQRRDILLKIKGMEDELANSMWNIGDIKMPTPYQMRRYIAAKKRARDREDEMVRDQLNGSGAAMRAAQGSVTNETTIYIDGADIAKIEKVIDKYVGKATRVRTAQSRRR